MYIHIFDAHSEDRYVVQEAQSDDEITSTREYIIQLFGATPEGAPVQIDVTGFRPFLFVSLPNCRTASDEQRWKSRIVAQLTKSVGGFDATLVKRGLLYGYTGGKQFPFLQLSVSSMSAFYGLKKALLTDTQTPKMTVDGHTLSVYESNIDPMLRFFHMRNINPCGWISIDDIDSEDDDIHIECAWTDIDPCKEPPAPVAPFRQVVWDIECDSFDGSFPVAKQGYRRVAKQLWTLCESAEEIPAMLTAAFRDVIDKTNKCPLKIPPLKAQLRSMPSIPASLAETCRPFWAKRDSAKEKEEGVQALTSALDRAFARTGIAGDPIIQIGSVLVDGSVSRHIFVLGTCDPIPGVIVHSVKDETTLLQEWIAWLVESRVDIFVGYNTNCFDEKYVWDRLEELGLNNESYVQQLSRLYIESDGKQHEFVKLEEKKLASSALGDNTLFIWTTPGRLRIDLLGHIRRKAQLPSYKLDSVCAVYLSGVLKGIEPLGDGKWLLKTKEKKDARVGRAIQILDGLGEDLTDKLIITGVTEDGILVSSDEDLSILGEAERWAVVKDDVSPQDIFRLQKGSSADRAIVAAYCIQDCELTYELYKKLEVFNETMSMANVCSVPVSYIFTRGQGIKIESLIFKDCRELGQLIKVLEVPPREPTKSRYSDNDSYYDLYQELKTKYNEVHSSIVQSDYELCIATTDKKAKGFAEKKRAFEKLIENKIYAEMPKEGYEGAVVLVPEPNFYTSPVGVCDFASLYPSTIISENISYDMLVWVKDFTLTGELITTSYGSVEDEKNAPPGTRWTDIEFDIMSARPDDHRKNPVKERIGVRVCRFAQPAENGKGTLPKIVAKLLAARKAKRVEITKTADPFKKALLDAEQNAYKVTANSLYGQLGSPTFKIRLQNLAASVTAYGRKQIMYSKEAIERFYGPGSGDPRCSAGAEIVYGDSVTGDTPLYLRTAEGTHIKRIDEMVKWDTFEAWHGTKESIALEGVSVWTEKGWTDVKRIIRHKLAPTKRLFRVLTHSGLVDCTEDHSLVDAEGKDVKPTDTKIGTRLLHNFDVAKEFATGPAKEFTGGMDSPTEKEAWAMGLFLADGSADTYDYPSGKKATWAINKADYALLEKAATHLPFDTKILDTLESSGVYKLVVCGDVKKQALMYRRLFYNDSREKRVPACILNASLPVVEAFISGFYAGDGDKANGIGLMRWYQKGKEVSAGLYILAGRLGYKASFNDRADKQDVIRTTITKNSQRRDLLAIKKIRELPHTNDYVYDLETENHHFSVGPGALVVHNTDSIFINFNPKNPETGEALVGREAVVATIELTEEAGKFITGTLKEPHDFEYDKVFYPFIIFSKKRYVGNKYEESPDAFKETSMGIVLKRRDNAPLLKMIYGAAIQELLLRQDVVAATRVVQEGVRALVEGKMKLSQLTITKSLRSEYKTTPPAHKILADRMAIRDPGNAPASGERVGYVYVKPPPGQKASPLQGDRVETPAFIREKGLEPDFEYYILHQLMNPLSQLFGIFVDKMPGFVAPPAWEEDPISQKEQMASDLLFREGLSYCKQSAKKAFVGMFSSPSISSSFATSIPTPTLTRSLQRQKGFVPIQGDPSIMAEVKKMPKQSMITSFLRDSSGVSDAIATRLAKKKKPAEK